MKSFTHKKYSNETELSKHIWHLKQNKTDFTIKWSIIKKSISNTGGSNRCNLCLDEKISILFGLPTQKYISGKQPKQRKECMLVNHPRASLSTKEARIFSKFVYHLKILSG